MILYVTNYFDFFLLQIIYMCVCSCFGYLQGKKKSIERRKNKLKPIKTSQIFTGFQMHFLNRNNRSLHQLCHICETSYCFLDQVILKGIEPSFVGVMFRSLSSRILSCSFLGIIVLWFISIPVLTTEVSHATFC